MLNEIIDEYDSITLLIVIFIVLENFFCSISFCLIFLHQPIYGFASGGPLRFKRAIGHRDLFYIDDKDVDLKDVRIFW